MCHLSSSPPLHNVSLIILVISVNLILLMILPYYLLFVRAEVCKGSELSPTADKAKEEIEYDRPDEGIV